MKKALIFCLALFLIFSLTGCAKEAETNQGSNTDPKTNSEPNDDAGEPSPDTSIRFYSELSDGTYECEGHLYKYRLVITGRMPKAARDSTFVYLSNLPKISFEQAWKAAGLSSDTADYFSPEDAALVDIR